MAFVRPLSYFNPSERARGAPFDTRNRDKSLRCRPGLLPLASMAIFTIRTSSGWNLALWDRAQMTSIWQACLKFVVEKELMNMPNRRMKAKNMKTSGTSQSLALKVQLTEFQFPLTSRRSHSGGMWKTGQIISNRSISTRRERLPACLPV